MTAPANRRVRFRFTKVGKVRFTSHRDVARLWERALRRAQLPVARTEGFNPRPKVHFGLALPTGYESAGEYLDVDLRLPEAADVDLAVLPATLTPLLPPGLDVTAAASVAAGTSSLQQAVTSCSWRIEALGPTPAEATAEVERLLSAASLPVTRQRKGEERTDDIRPEICSLAVTGPVLDGDDVTGTVLDAELATQPRGLRPSELLSAFSPRPEEVRPPDAPVDDARRRAARATRDRRDVGTARGGACVMRAPAGRPAPKDRRRGGRPAAPAPRKERHERTGGGFTHHPDRRRPGAGLGW
ncbi:MAG: TIGR03936 family radical SAM-associated protein [Acidimicrobiales bacterium]